MVHRPAHEGGFQAVRQNPVDELGGGACALSGRSIADQPRASDLPPDAAMETLRCVGIRTTSPILRDNDGAERGAAVST